MHIPNFIYVAPRSKQVLTIDQYNLLMKPELSFKNQNTKLVTQHFMKENIQISNKHMKRFSTLLIIKEMDFYHTKKKMPFPTQENYLIN